MRVKLPASAGAAAHWECIEGERAAVLVKEERCTDFGSHGEGGAQPSSTIASGPTNDARQGKLRHIGHEFVIERVRGIRLQMVVRIAEFRGIRPHDGGNARPPEWRVIATVQISNRFFYSEINLQRKDGEFRNVTRSPVIRTAPLR